MAEYIIVSVFLGLFVWYAIVGGSVNGTTKSGGWMETDINVAGTGETYDKYHPTDTAIPGLIQAIHEKQETFSESIYQP